MENQETVEERARTLNYFEGFDRHSQEIDQVRLRIDELLKRESNLVGVFALAATIIGAVGGWGILSYNEMANERAERAINSIEDRALRSIGIAESYIERFEEDLIPSLVRVEGIDPRDPNTIPFQLSISSDFNGGLPLYELQGRTSVIFVSEQNAALYLGSHYSFGGSIIDLISSIGPISSDNLIKLRLGTPSFQSESARGITVNPDMNFRIDYTLTAGSRDCFELEKLIDRIEEHTILNGFAGTLNVIPVVAGPNVPTQEGSFRLTPYYDPIFGCNELVQNQRERRDGVLIGDTDDRSMGSDEALSPVISED